jgi:hypothetical protein
MAVPFGPGHLAVADRFAVDRGQGSGAGAERNLYSRCACWHSLRKAGHHAPYPEGILRVALFADPAGNGVGIWQETASSLE